MFKVIACITVALTACATAGKSEDLPAIDAPSKPVDAPPAPPPIGVDAAVNACQSSDSCTGAMMLGSVSGDTGNDKLNATGYRSAWFRVRVTEDDSGILGLTLRVSAKLTSPAAAAFDVFVYLNSGSDVVECSTTVGSPSMNGNVDLTQAEWGEGAIANGADDGRDVSIEVRPVSGACVPDQMWQLDVEGNWL